VDEKAMLIKQLLVHPDIIEIRGKGFLMAVKLESNDRVLRIMNRCYELGLITDWFLFADDCLRIAPPLVITHEEINQACQIIMKAISDTETA
jgi:acetylornithine/succinyldiaminopimelate/putrescine aminotransferase